MKKSRYAESQIIKVMHEVKGGKMMKDVCREYVISESSYFKVDFIGVFHEKLHNWMIRIYKILMQEELLPEEKIRNKSIPRKKEIEFFLIFSTIRPVINGMSN